MAGTGVDADEIEPTTLPEMTARYAGVARRPHPFAAPARRARERTQGRPLPGIRGIAAGGGAVIPPIAPRPDGAS